MSPVKSVTHVSGCTFGIAQGIYGDNSEAFLLQTLDSTNKAIDSFTEELRRVESWPDP